MAALHNDGADAPGPAAPERSTNDEPRELAGGAGSKGQAQRVSLDFATGAVWLLVALSWIVWIMQAIEGRL